MLTKEPEYQEIDTPAERRAYHQWSNAGSMFAKTVMEESLRTAGDEIKKVIKETTVAFFGVKI